MILLSFFFSFLCRIFFSSPLVTISFTYDTFLSMIFTFCRFLLKTRNRHVSNVAHYNFYSTHSKIVVSLAYYKIAKIYEYKFSSTSACEIYFYDNLGLIIITILNMILGCPPISLLDSTQPSSGDFGNYLLFVLQSTAIQMFFIRMKTSSTKSKEQKISHYLG